VPDVGYGLWRSSFPSAAYVAGTIHRWDLRRPSPSSSQLSLEVPDDRHDPVHRPSFPSSRPLPSPSGSRSPGSWPGTAAWPARPAAHVRRPQLDYESHATALDRNELGALLVAAGLERRLSTR
jgi:hypothetical protein